MGEETRQRCQTPAHCRSLTPLLFTHQPFPRHDGAMINLTQLVWRLNIKGAHEMRHVIVVGPACAGTLATRQPDLFFRDAGELVDTESLERSAT
jgi:hypothetical protein